MANPKSRPRWLERLQDILPRAVGVTWALCMAWVLFVAARDHHPVFTSRFECGTDPLDILRPGELLDRSTMRFVVDAHCTNARYLSDELIELRYGGGRVDVETRKFNVAGTTHYAIVSVGGVAAD
jgi:hypothetical protein